MRRTIRLLLTCIFVGLFAIGCSKQNEPTVVMPAQVKRYQLKGKVVSIDKQARMANIDSEAIPGFMDAMTMPYQLKPESELDKLSPGDQITADVVVQDENSWLENISVTGHRAVGNK